MKFNKKEIRKFLNESSEYNIYKCNCNNCPVCLQQNYMENGEEIDDDDYQYLNSDRNDYHDEYDHHPGEADSPPVVGSDGVISPEDLYQHFDVDNDGVVDMQDYADHVDYHCEHPELLEDYLDLKDYRREDVHCHDSYSKCCDHLMTNSSSALELIRSFMSACGSTCEASTASALADVLELLKSKNLI